MIIDKNYCMSSFLALRHVAKPGVAWKEDFLPRFKHKDFNHLVPVSSAMDIDVYIKQYLAKAGITKNTGILLSGGMDSAILATYLPPGTKAYTLRSVAPGAVNEVEQAAFYADMCSLDLTIVDVTWEDYLSSLPELMRFKKSPIHSIEPLLYKAMLTAKKDGVYQLLSGESADVHFGGMDGLLSKNWTYEEFMERYNYCDPSKILITPVDISNAYSPYKTEYGIDAHRFVSEIFAEEGLNSYLNASDLAGVKFMAPYSMIKMGIPIDLDRIRNGESKYLIRELFSLRYPGLTPNQKRPMPRAVGIWLKDWRGPKRPEFKEGCIEGLSNDQKWLVFVLENFLNMIE